jgi:signal transduction histidine kinase
LNLPDTGDEVGRLAATFDSMLERLDAAFRRERQFTADASHELRTPLAAMQTIIGGTLARRRTAQEYEEALADLDREAENMRVLTDGLLQLARNDAAKQHSRYEAVDLSLLLKDVADSLRPVAEEKGLRLIEAVPDWGLEIAGDSDGLIRLFANLLDNAIKYTEEGSIVLAATAHNGDTTTVTVSDTGVGIAPEHLPHVFDRFYRVDEARATQGIGLGLAIAQDIARAHGGNIEVTSEPGRGTTFTVQLATKHGEGGPQGDAADD